MSKLKLFLLTGFLAAAVVPMYGCGSECGPGTTEQDGQCVLVAEGCGEGTILENKACVVNDTGCAEGTTLSQDRQCIPASETCADGTTFDQALRVCVADTEIVCGEGTVEGDDGICVPSEQACGEKTVLDEQGRCIVEAAACGAGTELDPNSGMCVLTGDACGTGLAFNTDSGVCEPTASICDTGTAFDADSGLCLPDACQEGDVLVDGICMNPVEELAHNADLQETENNDPAFGGTAETATLNAVGEEAFTFAGAIGAPADLDADGQVDQDVDVFNFDATAGQWIELMVQTTGLPAPAFKVEGPNNYVRYSRRSGAGEVARDIVIPADGTYSVTVLPSLVLEEGAGTRTPSGADNWGYVGSLNVVDAPAATDVDISGGTANISGDLVDLSDNLFNLSGVTDAQTLTFSGASIADNAEAIIQVWADETTLHSSNSIISNGSVSVGVPQTGTARVLVDWVRLDGASAEFDIDAQVTGSQTYGPIADGASESLTVDVGTFDRLIVSQLNPSGTPLDVVVSDPNGDIVFGRRIASNEQADTLVFDSGTYTVELSNNSGASVDAQLMVHVVSPTHLGQVGPDAEVTTSPSIVLGGESSYYALDVDAGEVLSFLHDNAQTYTADIIVYNDQGEVLGVYAGVYPTSSSGFDDDDFNWTYLQNGGSVLVEVRSGAERTGATLTVASTTPPHEGTLTLDNEISFSNAEALPEGYSAFHLFEVGAPGLGYSGLLTSDDGNDLDVSVWTLDGKQLLSASSSGGEEGFGGLSENGGTYLLEVQCYDPCNGYSVTMSAYPTVEDLGTPPDNVVNWSTPVPVLDTDQTVTVNFNVPAGRIIEVAFDDDNNTSAGLLFSDGSGTELVSDDYVYPLSYTSSWGTYPDIFHHYTETGGDFSVVLTGNYTGAENARVMVRLIDPLALGTVPQTGALTHTDDTDLGYHQWYVQEFTVPADSAFTGAVTPTNGSDSLTVRLTDTSLNTIETWYGYGSAVGISGTVDTETTYWLVTQCSSTCEGIDLAVELYQLVDDLGTFTADESRTHTIGTLNDGQLKELTFNVPAGQVIEISHVNNENEDHDFTLLDANGNEVVSDSTTQPVGYSSGPDLLYHYSENGGDYTLRIESNNVVSGEEVTINLITPGVLDELTAGGTVTASDTAALGAYQSYVRVMDVAEAMTFDGELTSNNSAGLDFIMLDGSGNEVVDATGTFSATVPVAGTYLVLIQTDADATGFDLTLSNGTSISEALGDVSDTTVNTTAAPFADGQLKTFTFTANAGQMIEIFHDNTEVDDHDFTLYDSNGVVIDSDSYMYPLSYSSPNYIYWYTETGGTFSLAVEGRDDVTGQVFSVRGYAPNAPTALNHNDVVTLTEADNGLTQVLEAQNDLHMVTLNQDGTLKITGASGGSNDIDLRIYDMQMNQVFFSTTSSSGIDTLWYSVSAGTYFIGIEPDNDITSYSVDVELAPPPVAPDWSSAPGSTIVDNMPAGSTDTITVSGCATIDAVEVFVDITHGYMGDVEVELTSPDGTSVMLHDNTGGSSDDLYGWYPSPLTPAASLAAFNGETGNGDWTLRTADTAGGIDGVLNEWGLTLTCQ